MKMKNEATDLKEKTLLAKEYGPQYIKKYCKSIRDFSFKEVKDMKRRGNLNDRSRN